MGVQRDLYHVYVQQSQLFLTKKAADCSLLQKHQTIMPSGNAVRPF